jgi:MOSC domain-containing protein YiiM
MQVISVNIGRAEAIQIAKKSQLTGIYKRATQDPVYVTTLGLSEDAICSTQHHGGVDQAVYVYGTSDYAWWSAELGVELEPGTFGENVTISALESSRFWVGDRIQVGAVTLEVTAPRIPCATLATRMGDPAFVKHFRAAERPGLYCRVIREGFIQTGDLVTHERYRGEPITVIEMFRDFYNPSLSVASLKRYLDAPIAIRDRVEKEEQLRKVS